MFKVGDRVRFNHDPRNRTADIAALMGRDYTVEEVGGKYLKFYDGESPRLRTFFIFRFDLAEPGTPLIREVRDYIDKELGRV